MIWNEELVDDLEFSSVQPSMDSASDHKSRRRQQLYAAAAAGNLSPIPSDNETGDHMNNNAHQHDEEEEEDLNSVQPPDWAETPDGSMLSDGSEDSLELASAAPHHNNGVQSPSKAKVASKATTKGPKIVMPEKQKAGHNNSHTASSSTSSKKSSASASKPGAKSRLPRMEQVISSIPKPKLTRQQPHTRPSLGSTGSSTGGSQENIDLAKHKQAPNTRENKSSMQRKKHMVVQLSRDKEEEEKEGDYLTPLQKKNQYIKELENELKELKATLKARERDLSEADSMRSAEIRFIVSEKKAEISVLEERLQEVEAAREEVQNKYGEALATIKAYETTIKELEAKLEKKDRETKEMYLVMYKKGQQSALFERQVQLEELAASAPQSVDVHELLAKLEKTQGELTKWQSIQRQSSYESGERPDTEAAATLRFLRDSMFHYLSDGRDQAQHLKAMISILGFTEVQMKKIKKAMVEHHK